MTWQNRFDRLLKAMTQGEPHKAAKRDIKRIDPELKRPPEDKPYLDPPA